MRGKELVDFIMNLPAYAVFDDIEENQAAYDTARKDLLYQAYHAEYITASEYARALSFIDTRKYREEKSKRPQRLYWHS